MDCAKRVKVGQAPADMAPWRHNGCRCKSIYGTDTKILLTLAERNQNYVFAGVPEKNGKGAPKFSVVVELLCLMAQIISRNLKCQKWTMTCQMLQRLKRCCQTRPVIHAYPR
ncbi:uncharacterized protein LOC124686568 [Lolium rigidum]|uniref:uncharacterized protein LOC124686568 n=1 Tax=Lolium rigidum TaxID=89674 RepID=UPI001F5CD97B|nr:uncharacterized protein LOC124686568 [Lolium rigidum]